MKKIINQLLKISQNLKQEHLTLVTRGQQGEDINLLTLNKLVIELYQFTEINKPYLLDYLQYINTIVFHFNLIVEQSSKEITLEQKQFIAQQVNEINRQNDKIMITIGINLFAKELLNYNDNNKQLVDVAQAILLETKNIVAIDDPAESNRVKSKAKTFFLGAGNVFLKVLQGGSNFVNIAKFFGL